LLSATVKKLCWHTSFGEIEVIEPQYRRGTQRVRPFARSARVSARGCSRPLQRVITDFGADLPYARAMDKLVEHYGVVIPQSTMRRLTLVHAQRMHQRCGSCPQGLPERLDGCRTLIAQIDGSMIPTVSASQTALDKRKGKKTQWQEVKLSLAHVVGSTQVYYAATLQGDAAVAGRQWRACAKRAGLGRGHHVHGLGDGAPWIRAQFQSRFGRQGSYLLDFYHVCEYLGQAAQAMGSNERERADWLALQKQRLKTHGGLDALLRTLRDHEEAPECADELAPVRRCLRYLNHRQDQLDYASAIDKELPIGSGEIESAHRYVIQKRLKLPGAWWREDNAQHMLALRLNRANGEWNAYWNYSHLYVDESTSV